LPEKKKGEKKESAKNQIAVWSPDEYAREMDRVFSDFERRLGRSFLSPVGGSWLFPSWRSFGLPETRRPFADMIDAGNEYRVRAEVPGIPKEKLNISVTPREIKIEGEAETNIDEKKEGFVHRERTYSKVKRDLMFPEEVIPDKADAIVKDGVLEVRVPKKTPTEAKTHKVQVK
jgi:HSP20 family protein